MTPRFLVCATFLSLYPVLAQIGSPPAIASISGAGLSTPAVTAITSGGIITIFGSNFTLAGVTHTLQASDITGGTTMPTNLAQTCVQIGGFPAPLYYVSSNQINAQATAVPTSGSVQVTVIANCGTVGQATSAPFTVQLAASAPEFLYFKNNSVAAVEVPSGALVGTAGLVTGANFTLAKPGDTLSIYGVGFGATSPAVPPGILATAATSTVGTAVVTIGGITATVLYAGLAPGYAGLYQVNLVVPMGVQSGNQPITIQVNGGASPITAYLPIAATTPGVMSISISGNRFLDGSGNVVQLRGVNLSGMEFTAVQGWDPSTRPAAISASPTIPTGLPSAVGRPTLSGFLLNEASWLALTCTDTDGVAHQADPGGNYKLS